MSLISKMSNSIHYSILTRAANRCYDKVLNENVAFFPVEFGADCAMEIFARKRPRHKCARVKPKGMRSERCRALYNCSPGVRGLGGSQSCVSIITILLGATRTKTEKKYWVQLQIVEARQLRDVCRNPKSRRHDMWALHRQVGLPPLL